MTEASRFVLLGTGGNFTLQVLQRLIGQSFIPLCYIQSGTSPVSDTPPLSIAQIEIQQPESVLKQLLDNNNIPLYSPSSHTLAALILQQQADYLLVACWPWLLSNDVIQAVSIAALNLHPSLLPAYRGPDPITQQMLLEDHRFGVSLHLLNEYFDQGDIVLQQPLTASGPAPKQLVETMAAEIGAELFMQAVSTQLTPGWQLCKQATV
ncbi:MAG: hypothetical protein ISR73_01645 [Gammaproteobacteria bacterium]|nr:hypothetical protein [Gammaproteobacteria bacterium]